MLLKSIFRTIHTIKGSCGFLGFSHLEKVAHAADGIEVNLESANTIQVVIYSEQERTVGLLVDRIIDIVHEYGALESLAPRLGVTGTLVAQQHVTELLDVPAIVKAALPGTREDAQGVAAGG